MDTTSLIGSTIDYAFPSPPARIGNADVVALLLKEVIDMIVGTRIGTHPNIIFIYTGPLLGHSPPKLTPSLTRTPILLCHIHTYNQQ